VKLKTNDMENLTPLWDIKFGKVKVAYRKYMRAIT